ncbi:MFS transporter [Streptomyces kanamyceticus]|uniref:DHA2 family efflux MFS transporter permease subunit n=1 Tax=Streptomyces kanamyceticus TaxID=1967 RepID=A0A5J6GDT8_STRKN|nr:MFS transporter [Streptomyces kanamyceticus]QEU93097.1 DHA2 family efflux MFS transporter permease subunit [Streptomyces kanamyceticus]
MAVDAPARQGPSPYRTLPALCVPLALTMLQSTVLSTALPDIQDDLNGGIQDIQWVISGYSLAFAALMLTGGTCGDRFGRKKTFLTGLAVFLGGAVFSALAGSVWVLVAAQAVLGVGAALLMPNTLSIIRHVFTDSGERGTAIGIWAAVAGAAVAFGPVVGGPLVENFGWAGIFWMYVPIAVLGFVLAVRMVPESSNPERRLDPAGLVLSVAAMSAIVYATIEGGSRGWSDRLVVGTYLAGGVLLIAFVITELRVREPMLDLSFFRDRVFTGSVIAGFVLYFGLFAITYFLMLWLQTVLGWSAVGAGLAILPGMLLAMVSAPLAGWMTSKVGGAIPLGLGILFASLTMFGASLYGADARYAEYWWVVLLVGLGIGLTLTPISTLVMMRVPAARSGMASGASNATRQLGSVFGVAVLGTLLTTRMTDSVRDRLTDAHVPAAARDEVVRAVEAGGAQSAGSGGGSARITALVNDGFVDGLHLAERVGGALLLVTAVAVYFLVRGRDRDDIETELTERTGSEDSGSAGQVAERL